MSRTCVLVLAVACAVVGVMTVSQSVAADAARGSAGQTNLKLFELGVTWKYGQVDAKGSFELGKDGDQALGTLSYDFSLEGKHGKGRYVLASTEIKIADNVKEIHVNARANKKQPIGIRLVDDSGQKHQFKKKLAGTGKWETVTLSLTKKTEHWSGANDGVIHFPIKTLVVIASAPGEDAKTGKVDFADVVTTAK